MKENTFKILFATVLVTLQVVNLIALIHAQKKSILGLGISALLMLCLNFIAIYILKKAHIKITNYDNQAPVDLLAYVGLLVIILFSVFVASIIYCYMSAKVHGIMVIALPILSAGILVLAIGIFDKLNSKIN